jgi:hypothetical protein
MSYSPLPRFWCVVDTQGSIVCKPVKFHRAVESWGPGTWLGRGDSKEEAKADAIRQADEYRMKIEGTIC